MIFQLVTTHQVNFGSLSCTSSKRILVPQILPMMPITLNSRLNAALDLDCNDPVRDNS
jgi:hypothetical protein